jgi:hypothetical protein
VTRERRAIKEIRDLQVFGRCKLMERKVVTRVKRWFQHFVRAAVRPMVPNAQTAPLLVFV